MKPTLQHTRSQWSNEDACMGAGKQAQPAHQTTAIQVFEQRLYKDSDAITVTLAVVGPNSKA